MKKLLSSLLCLSMMLLYTGNSSKQIDTDNSCANIASENITNECTVNDDKPTTCDNNEITDIVKDITDAVNKANKAQTTCNDASNDDNISCEQASKACDVQTNCDSKSENAECNNSSCAPTDCNKTDCTQANCKQNTCTDNSCDKNTCADNSCAVNSQSSCPVNSSEKANTQNNSCAQNSSSNSCAGNGNSTQSNSSSLLDYINSTLSSYLGSDKSYVTITPSAPPSSTTSNGTASSNASTAKSEAMQVFEIVNKQRTANGLPALTYRNDLQAVADLRAKEITVLFSHTRPNSTSCFTAVSEAGIPYTAVGENIAYGQQNANSVMNAWMNSSGHRANILSNKFTGMAVGLTEIGGVKYWVQIFIK